VSGPIVVGYDGSDASEAALGRAIEEAREADAKLVVVTVAPMHLEAGAPTSFGTLGDGFATPVPVVEPPEFEATHAAAAERIDAASVQADYVRETGDPSAALIREARQRGAAAIVVGHGHHSRLGRWLGTDIAAEVERDAGCPVIVVEP
jgi:nucleotide-binding universal stress UspA family protein